LSEGTRAENWVDLAVGQDGAVPVAFSRRDRREPPLSALPSCAGDVHSHRSHDDGRRAGERPRAVGPRAQVVIGKGIPAIVYQDGTGADVLWAQPGKDGTWERRALWSGPVPQRFYLSAAAQHDWVWVASYRHDQGAWPPGHTEVLPVE
jgi:hypothetical protein